MTQLAYGYIIAALLSVTGGSVAYALAFRAGDGERMENRREWGRHGFRFAALMVVLASVYLSFFFITRHYEVDYVFHNSSADLPLIFRFSSFWAGQEGSFMLWALWTGVICVVLTKKAGKAETSVMPFMGMVFAFILVMIALINPFKTSPGLRTDGMGLNPLLQDYWMAIHPPTLFLGFSLMAVPFAFAMGALVRRDYRDWVRAAAPWAIAAPTVLVMALSMGGHWAYRTLGWGGFWGWDPVENASMVPMLVGLALIHGMFLQRGANAAAQRGNIGLAITGFAAVMYASYLTRSGVLAQFSNHSFSELPHGGALLGGLVFFLVLGYGAFLWRYRDIPSLRAYEGLASREFGFYVSVVILMIAAALVCVGTSAPLITGWMGKPQTVDAAFYNWTLAPVGGLIALMLALYPITARNGIAPAELKRRLAVPLGLAVMAALVVGILWRGGLSAAHLVTAIGLAFAGVLALSLNLMVVARMARRGGLTSAGGYIAHVGFGVLLLGIVASAIYSRTERVKVTMDDHARAFGWTFRMLNRGQQDGPLRTQIPIWVSQPGGAAADGFVVRPSMARDRNGNQMTAPGISSHLLYDLYVASAGAYDPGHFPSMPITLRPNEVFNMGPLKLFFAGITEEGEKGTLSYGIKANLLAMRGKENVPVGPELNLQAKTGTIVSLPGGSRINIDPDTQFNGALTFDFIGPMSQRTPPYAFMDVTMKPVIWLAWLGMVLTVLGGFLAALRRAKENRRRDAELLDRGEPAVPIPEELAL